MNTKRRILWITARWPLPARDGSRQASCAGILQLTSSGEGVDLLSFSDQPISAVQVEEATKSLGVSNVYVIPKRYRFKKIFRAGHALYSLICSKSLPFTYIPFKFVNLEESLNQVLRTAWSHIIFDGPHTAAFFINGEQKFFGKNIKFIYRAHNVESSLWHQAASKAFLPVKFLLSIQFRKVRIYEQKLLDNCAGLACVSQEDLNQFKLIYKLPISKVIPIGLDFGEAPPVYNGINNHSEISLLFIGGTSWGPNRAGIIWFLEEVWPVLCTRRKDIFLVIAGRGTENLRIRFKSLPNLKILGEVEDLKELYAKSHASIIPIFYGSGTRVKAIEAGCFARACISTEIGVAGLPLVQDKSYIRAETKENWANILNKLDKTELEIIGKEAYQTLKTTFDKKAVAQDFVKLLDALQEDSA